MYVKQSPNKSMNLLSTLFDQSDRTLWDSTTRSIRIGGTVTSVRLENFFWRVLGDMASEAGLQIPQLLTALSKESSSSSDRLTNFTSFVRVCCGRYLDTKLTQREPTLD